MDFFAKYPSHQAHGHHINVQYTLDLELQQEEGEKSLVRNKHKYESQTTGSKISLQILLANI
jgi:hypothetical protein